MACFRMKKHLGVSLPGALFYMWKKGQFYHLDDSIEIHRYGCEECGFHMEGNDESS